MSVTCQHMWNQSWSNSGHMSSVVNTTAASLTQFVVSSLWHRIVVARSRDCQLLKESRLKIALVARVYPGNCCFASSLICQ